MSSVTEVALVARINRRLRRDGERLRKSRGERSLLNFGAYYIEDIAFRHVCQHDVDVESLADELGLLRGNEQLVQTVQS